MEKLIAFTISPFTLKKAAITSRYGLLNPNSVRKAAGFQVRPVSGLVPTELHLDRVMSALQQVRA